MRLQKVLELTKLSKKAVYFYIKEELIHPAKDINNGYYDFSEEDLKKLQIITCLRKTGMPIQEIKEIFIYPTLTNFFIHRQVNNLKKCINEQINQLKMGYYLINEIPANATPDNLKVALDFNLNQQLDTNSHLDSYFPNLDARMIAILICAAFMDIEESVYHSFLWEKISKELTLQLDSKLIYLKKLIYSLSPAQIEKTSVAQYMICKNISKATEEELKSLEDNLYEYCKELSMDQRLQKYWCLVYEPILIPTLSFINSKASVLLNEYNPRYKKFNKNSEIIATNVLNRLKEEKTVLNSLKERLHGSFNPENLNYAELIYLFVFKDSIYTQLNIEDLELLLMDKSKNN